MSRLHRLHAGGLSKQTEARSPFVNRGDDKGNFGSRKYTTIQEDGGHSANRNRDEEYNFPQNAEYGHESHYLILQRVLHSILMTKSDKVRSADLHYIETSASDLVEDTFQMHVLLSVLDAIVCNVVPFSVGSIVPRQEWSNCEPLPHEKIHRKSESVDVKNVDYWQATETIRPAYPELAAHVCQMNVLRSNESAADAEHATTKISTASKERLPIRTHAFVAAPDLRSQLGSLGLCKSQPSALDYEGRAVSDSSLQNSVEVLAGCEKQKIRERLNFTEDSSGRRVFRKECEDADCVVRGSMLTERALHESTRLCVEDSVPLSEPRRDGSFNTAFLEAMRSRAQLSSIQDVVVSRPFSASSRLLALQVYTSVCVTLDAVANAPRWIERIIGLLFDIIRRTNEYSNAVFRSCACSCLEELELSYPGILSMFVDREWYSGVPLGLLRQGVHDVDRGAANDNDDGKKDELYLSALLEEERQFVAEAYASLLLVVVRNTVIRLLQQFPMHEKGPVLARRSNGAPVKDDVRCTPTNRDYCSSKSDSPPFEKRDGSISEDDSLIFLQPFVFALTRIVRLIVGGLAYYGMWVQTTVCRHLLYFSKWPGFPVRAFAREAVPLLYSIHPPIVHASVKLLYSTESYGDDGDIYSMLAMKRVYSLCKNRSLRPYYRILVLRWALSLLHLQQFVQPVDLAFVSEHYPSPSDTLEVKEQILQLVLAQRRVRVSQSVLNPDASCGNEGYTRSTCFSNGNSVDSSQARRLRVDSRKTLARVCSALQDYRYCLRPVGSHACLFRFLIRLVQQSEPVEREVIHSFVCEQLRTHPDILTNSTLLLLHYLSKPDQRVRRPELFRNWSTFPDNSSYLLAVDLGMFLKRIEPPCHIDRFLPVVKSMAAKPYLNPHTVVHTLYRLITDTGHTDLTSQWLVGMRVLHICEQLLISHYQDAVYESLCNLLYAVATSEAPVDLRDYSFLILKFLTHAGQDSFDDLLRPQKFDSLSLVDRRLTNFRTPTFRFVSEKSLLTLEKSLKERRELSNIFDGQCAFFFSEVSEVPVECCDNFVLYETRSSSSESSNGCLFRRCWTDAGITTDKVHSVGNSLFPLRKYSEYCGRSNSHCSKARNAQVFRAYYNCFYERDDWTTVLVSRDGRVPSLGAQSTKLVLRRRLSKDQKKYSVDTNATAGDLHGLSPLIRTLPRDLCSADTYFAFIASTPFFIHIPFHLQLEAPLQQVALHCVSRTQTYSPTMMRSYESSGNGKVMEGSAVMDGIVCLSEVYGVELVFGHCESCAPIQSVRIPFLQDSAHVDYRRFNGMGFARTFPFLYNLVLKLQPIDPVPTTVEVQARFNDAAGNYFCSDLSPFSISFQDLFLPICGPFEFRSLLFECIWNDRSSYRSVKILEFGEDVVKRMIALTLQPFVFDGCDSLDTETFDFLQDECFVDPSAALPLIDSVACCSRKIFLQTKVESSMESALSKCNNDAESLVCHTSVPRSRELHPLSELLNCEEIMPDSLMSISTGSYLEANSGACDFFVDDYFEPDEGSAVASHGDVKDCGNFTLTRKRGGFEETSYDSAQLDTKHAIVFLPPKYHLLLRFTISPSTTVVRIVTDRYQILQYMDAFFASSYELAVRS